MSLLRASKINKSYGPETVLANLYFTLERGEKVALTGLNGLGKSTLLKIIAGVEEVDNGKLTLAKGARLAYLPQDFTLEAETRVADYLGEVGQVLKLDHRVKIMLDGFGLGEDCWERKLGELSSGQKSKVALAAILLQPADLLLLDEPTNNLDLPALIWLEDFLAETEAAVIVVSHDRRFVDKVARKIWELNWETRALVVTGGRYSDYLEMEAKRLARRKLDYRLQQAEIERLANLARAKRSEAAAGARWAGTDNDRLLRGFKRDRAKGSARTAKVIEKKISRLEKLPDPLERPPLQLSLAAERGAGSLEIETKNLVIGYPDGFQLGPVNLAMRFGQRVGILGLNGSGKSTLLKTLAGELAPVGGMLSVGAGVKIGNLMQEHESLPREKTLLELVKEKTDLRVQDIYNLLQKFSFNEDQIKHPIALLSPGGRARLLLAIFSVQGINTLFLDEPTNHLDLEALAALEEMLANYHGTVILVTHDRYFLDVAKLDQLYLINENGFAAVANYQEYLRLAEMKAEKLLRQIRPSSFSV